MDDEDGAKFRLTGDNQGSKIQFPMGATNKWGVTIQDHTLRLKTNSIGKLDQVKNNNKI